MSDSPPQAGVFASLKRLLATMIEIVHNRLELVSVEIEQQIEYAAALLLWGIVAIFFGSLTVLLLAFLIVIVFWDNHRLLAAGLVTAAFALVAVISAFVVRARLAHRPRFLAASAGELQKDAAALDREPP